MNRSIRGNDRAQRFNAVCEPLRQDLFRFALWLSRSRSVAEDVVQETLLRAWRSFDALKDAAAARHWLLTIARREHARLYERKRHETVDIDELVHSETMALATRPENDIDPDQLRDVRRAILELEQEYREPLVLQVLMGYSTEEIATHMDLQQGAVLTRLFRARNQLREQLGLATCRPCDEKAVTEQPAKVTRPQRDVRMLRAQEQSLHRNVPMLQAQDAQEQPPEGGDEAVSEKGP